VTYGKSDRVHCKFKAAMLAALQSKNERYEH
jgi:hypothetical protein